MQGRLANIYLQRLALFAKNHNGHNVFLRGLIEFTNYCKNDCYYCGIRCSNHKATRYRLSLEEILLSCEIGYKNKSLHLRFTRRRRYVFF